MSGSKFDKRQKKYNEEYHLGPTPKRKMINYDAPQDYNAKLALAKRRELRRLKREAAAELALVEELGIF